MRRVITICWCLLAAIIGWFGSAHAGDIQMRETTQHTTRGPLVVKAFMAAGQGLHPAIIVLHGSQGLTSPVFLYQVKC